MIQNPYLARLIEDLLSGLKDQGFGIRPAALPMNIPPSPPQVGAQAEVQAGSVPEIQGDQSIQDLAPTAYGRAMDRIQDLLATQPDVHEDWTGPKPIPESYQIEGAGEISVPGGKEALLRIAEQAGAFGNRPTPMAPQSRFRTPSPQEVADATVVGPRSSPGPMYMEGGPPPYAGGGMRQGAPEPSLYGGRTPESMMRSYGWMEDAFPAEVPKSAEQVLLERAQTRPVYKRSPYGGGVVQRGLDQEAVTAMAYLEEMAKRQEQSRLAELGFAKDLMVADKYYGGRGSSNPLESTTGINQLASRLMETIIEDPNISPDEAVNAQREIIRVLYGGSPEEKQALLAKYGGGGAVGGGYEAEDDYLGKMGL